MDSLPTLSLFISSKMGELAPERRAVQEALSAFLLHGWLWETDAGARPEPIRSVYLAEVEACDIYIGLFWQGYGPYTIEEFEHARKHHKPCLVYDKHIELEKREAKLWTFLDGLQDVENRKGLTVCRFKTAEQLAEQVQKDVMRLLASTFKNSRKQISQPQEPSASPAMNVSATDHSIVIGNNYGKAEQHNYDISSTGRKRRNRE
jgi:hypothetical protein